MFTRINLYKNCILTARNTEVFRSQSILEEYLETLDKPYSTDIEIPNVYTTLSGTITIDAMPLNGDFNYIKFEEFDDNNVLKQKVYAFIDSFRLINDLYVIDYTTDVWHTYFKDCTIRNSLVIRSIKTIDGEPYELPLGYINNGDMEINSLLPTNESISHSFAVVMKIQQYKLSTGGSYEGITNEFYCAYDFLHYENDSTNNVIGFYDTSNVGALSDILDIVQSWQPFQNWWCYGNINNKTYARIVETYVIPSWWIKNTDLFECVQINELHYDYGNGTATFNIMKSSLYNIHRKLKTFKLNNSISEQYLPRLLSFGTFTKQIPYIFDGINKEINLYISLNRDEFAIYLLYDGHNVEITSEFLILQDYTPTTPDVLAQREIARKTQTVNGIVGIVSGAVQVGTSIATMGTTAGASNVINAGASQLAKFNQMKYANRLKAYGSTQAYENSLSSVKGTTSGIGSIVSGVMDIWAANQAKYMTFNIANNDTRAIVNAYYGLCYMYASTPINEREVEKAIEETGYSVSYFTDNIDITDETLDYNVIQFAFIRLTGLSTEICDKISEILTDGVKIWYTKNV